MKRKKYEVIVMTSKELTREERKNFKRDHPGQRLCFRLRYPNFPIYLSGALAIIAIAERLVLL